MLPICLTGTGVCPSGQREQTVNLPATPTVVRIHPLPRTTADCGFSIAASPAPPRASFRGPKSAIRSALCGRSSMARAPAFQAGSLPCIPREDKHFGEQCAQHQQYPQQCAAEQAPDRTPADLRILAGQLSALTDDQRQALLAMLQGPGATSDAGQAAAKAPADAPDAPQAAQGHAQGHVRDDPRQDGPEARPNGLAGQGDAGQAPAHDGAGDGGSADAAAPCPMPSPAPRTPDRRQDKPRQDKPRQADDGGRA